MNLYKKMFFFLMFNMMIMLTISIFFLKNGNTIIIEWEIFTLNSISIIYMLIFDFKSLFFMMLVSMISSMIMLYSNEYMDTEIFNFRFILLIIMFILSMMLMILSPNMISIMLGWDGLGLISYCLVIFYQNKTSMNSGLLTALSNRIGDVLILISIAWFMNYGSWNFMYYIYLFNMDFEMNMILLLMLFAAMTKSAQIPFSSWLPAAMAAPTPISALVHSSTLVTAGVYLLIRFYLLMENHYVLKILMFLSCMTMFMSGLTANFEYDLKKIIALSTLSQLGLMMMVLSLGMELLTLFHLFTHALFKSLLFMCAGIFIHFLNNNQDIRFMGNMIMYFPMGCLSFNIGNMALCGMPFMAGFYSKDLMMEMYLMENYNLFLLLLFYVSLGLTMSYSIRLMIFLLMGNNMCFPLFNFVEPMLYLKSMFILTLLSILGGSFIMHLILLDYNMIYLCNLMKFMLIIFMIFGMFLGIYCHLYMHYMMKHMNILFFTFNMWFLPKISTYGMNFYVLKINYNMLMNLDLGWFELIGPQGLFKNFMFFISKNQFFQLISVFFFFFFFFWLLFICILF
uniref:NADH-ubiquinone oxidoreductase chain 5 n=1 Tax=Ecnomus latus TaxID=623472 RepID=A0A9E8RTS1_9NEOP|nr:NADH dehydrogenase subunit 5 [Ecnomus latus]UZZ43905.1 NADH dehydrogenase subunit 5 [Ecnomus latus]